MKERKLSLREKIREAKVNKMVEQNEKEGYVKKELTLSALQAHVSGIVVAVIGFAAVMIPFAMMHELPALSFVDLAILISALVVGTFVHEGIHGLFFKMGVKNPKESIEYGFSQESYCPYCTCLEPLSKTNFLISILMPGLILGIIPSIIALFTGSVVVMMFGASMIAGAAGDILVAIKLLTYKTDKKDIILMDNPTKIGLLVLEK